MPDFSTPEPVEEQPLSPNDEQPNAPARRRRRRRKRPERGVLGRGTRIDKSTVRHQARVVAMQTLFELDQTDHDLESILQRLSTPTVDESPDDESANETNGDDVETVGDIPMPVLQHAKRLVNGVRENQSEIDPWIEAAAPAFPMQQLAAIDRCVLRIAVYELVKEPDIPFRAVINEAIEVAKHYGGPNSGRFVNGVLGTIHDRIEQQAATEASPAS